MSIDIRTETTCGFSRAGRLFGRGRGGAYTAATTVMRRATKGVLLPDGTVLRLEAVKLGLNGRWITSEEAVQRFVDRLAVAFSCCGDADPAPDTRERPHQDQV